MSVLGLLKKVKVQTLSFEKHPCRELDQEIMVHYLNGLALLTNEDGLVCEKEREYLEILINSFGLSEDMLETFIHFAENPDEKLILDMMQSFATKDIKYNFMVDAMMIATVDGEFDESEEAIVEQYFEMFKITADEAENLRYIYEMFQSQDAEALSKYFGAYSNNTMKIERFGYLIEYYDIEIKNYKIAGDPLKIIEFEDKYVAWYDEETKLLWEVKTEENIEDTYTFDEAKNLSIALNDTKHAGYDDWRVPTIEELKTLLLSEKVEGVYIKRPLSLNINNDSSPYWSSTSYASNSFPISNINVSKLVVDFYIGNQGYGNKGNSGYVRCVRAGQ